MTSSIYIRGTTKRPQMEAGTAYHNKIGLKNEISGSNSRERDTKL